MHKNIVLQDTTSGKHYNIILPCVLGRGQEADLDLPDLTISHQHALITRSADDQIWIEDLKSVNGVSLNDQKIKVKTILSPGDLIKLGKTKLLMSESEESISEQTVILQTLGPAEKRSLDHERLKMIYSLADR